MSHKPKVAKLDGLAKLPHLTVFCVFDHLHEKMGKIELFALWHLLRLVKRIIFKKKCPKGTFPSDFVKLVLISEILHLFLAEKMVVCCLCCLFVCCNTLSDFGLLFFKLKHS